MMLKTVTVEIDYRYDAGKCVTCEGKTWSEVDGCPRCGGNGHEPPRSKELIARIRQVDAEGFVFGKNLLNRGVVTRVDKAMQISRMALYGKVCDVVFVISDRLL